MQAHTLETCVLCQIWIKSKTAKVLPKNGINLLVFLFYQRNLDKRKRSAVYCRRVQSWALHLLENHAKKLFPNLIKQAKQLLLFLNKRVIQPKLPFPTENSRWCINKEPIEHPTSFICDKLAGNWICKPCYLSTLQILQAPSTWILRRAQKGSFPGSWWKRRLANKQGALVHFQFPTSTNSTFPSIQFSMKPQNFDAETLQFILFLLFSMKASLCFLT